MSEACTYCHGVGACPTCWGRTAIEELKAKNQKLAERRLVLDKLLREAVNLLGGFPGGLNEALCESAGINLNHAGFRKRAAIALNEQVIRDGT
jgi:hypothetical protein